MAGARERAARWAARTGEPVVDLSIGEPTDPTPPVVREALARFADAPGYPLTAGRRPLREAVVAWLSSVHGVTGLDERAVLPVVGTKELIGGLPLHLGLAAGDVVAHPTLAYPTYAVGAALVGARTVLVDDADDVEALPARTRGAAAPRLVWVNSPRNPTGAVLDAAELRRILAWCRAHDALLVSDECYLDLGWDARPVSVLHPSVSDGDHSGVLAVHSLSKRSNLAGYRIGFASGDVDVVAELVTVRRNLGLQVPEPQQGVAVVALGDEAHVAEQRERYRTRRDLLRPALEGAGFRVDHSEAGLYLWVTRDEPAAATVDALADVGVVVVTGEQYGAAGARHVRVALTGTDAGVAVVADRLAGLAPPSTVLRD